MLNNILNASNYEELCDFSIIPDEGKIFKEEFLKRNAIIFCKTDYIGYLFKCIESSDSKYNIITHHSDYAIDDTVFSYTPKSVNKWYAINAVCEHENLIGIPLGVKTHKGIYKESFYDIPWFSENIESFRSKNKNIEKVYCNWSNTNPERNRIVNQLKVDYFQEFGLDYKMYCESMSNFKFVISPPGNGVDCHRTWECLYMGSIPVVIKNSIYDKWYDLPILQVDDYSNLTYDMMYEFINREFNYEKLYLNYWKKEIQSL